MKKMNHFSKMRKYKNFVSGTLFALLGFPFLLWGFSIITKKNNSCFDMILPLLGILICILFGLRSMLRQDNLIKKNA
ncbi:MAG: hypothetical protein K0R92_1631 [Lachnospiraceae bacterium]|jgi:hypothetical protein|nr:hypothetical protein [Lachnospiraceae bacterium]